MIMQQVMPFVCVVGAPRSGTTILGDVLSTHPNIAYLFEPYFIWDYHIGPGTDDVRTADMVTFDIASWIRREFSVYLRRTGRDVLVDKSPFNSFRIPFVNRVFPDCKFVHIRRDGRDVAVSTNRKWLERIEYTQHGQYLKFVREVFDKLRRRPTIRIKRRAILYELRYNFRFKFKGYYAAYYNEGSGWGVRYPGFNKHLKEYTLLQFNALQWLYSINRIEKDLESIPRSRKLTIGYEEFVSNPDGVISDVIDFVGLPESSLVDVSGVAKSKQSTYKVTQGQLKEIMPLIEHKLLELGYLDSRASGAA